MGSRSIKKKETNTSNDDESYFSLYLTGRFWLCCDQTDVSE